MIGGMAWLGARQSPSNQPFTEQAPQACKCNPPSCCTTGPARHCVRNPQTPKLPKRLYKPPATPQLLYDRDRLMYWAAEDVPFSSRTTTLNEELGQARLTGV